MCQSRRLLYRVKQFDGNAQCLQWGMADITSMLPPIVFPPKTFLEQVGTGAIAKIVLHHHRLLRHSSISHMYPSNEAAFLEGVAKATHFLIEALGGEKIYTYSYGSPMLCRTHAPFAIDEQARFVWLEAYKQTLHDLAFPKEWIEVFWNWIESFSLRMVNQRTLLPIRIPYETIKGEFGIV